jgi:hypothetical protein
VDVDRHHADAARRGRPGPDERRERPARADGVQGRVAEHGGVEGRVDPARNQVPDGGRQVGRARDERGGAQFADQLLVAVARRGDHPQAAHGREFDAKPAKRAGRTGHEDRLPGGQAEQVQGLDGGQGVQRKRRRGDAVQALGNRRHVGGVEHDLLGIRAE